MRALGKVVKAADGRLRAVTLDDEAWLALGLIAGQHAIVVPGDDVFAGEVVVDRATGERVVLTSAKLRGTHALVKRP